MPWLGMPPAPKLGMNSAKQPTQGPRILIVEDDPVAARVYGQYLKKGGFHVMVATDGHTGLQKVRQLRPDGVLLDIMLPGLNGVEVLKEIRATNPDLPVVVYTNGFVPLLVDEVVAAGATHVFNKISLTAQELSNAFDKSLRRKAAA
jgi:two-component system response regulator (stage 0 sporulation protein F)